MKYDLLVRTKIASIKTSVRTAAATLTIIRKETKVEEPHLVSIHFAIVMKSSVLMIAFGIRGSIKPPVITFHSFDSPTVATGRNAKLSRNGRLTGLIRAAREKRTSNTART